MNRAVNAYYMITASWKSLWEGKT